MIDDRPDKALSGLNSGERYVRHTRKNNLQSPDQGKNLIITSMKKIVAFPPPTEIEVKALWFGRMSWYYERGMMDFQV